MNTRKKKTNEDLMFFDIQSMCHYLTSCGLSAQVMLTGRAMRIKLSGNCATVTDLDSGYKANKCSDNSQVSLFH